MRKVYYTTIKKLPLIHILKNEMHSQSTVTKFLGIMGRHMPLYFTILTIHDVIEI